MRRSPGWSWRSPGPAATGPTWTGPPRPCGRPTICSRTPGSPRSRSRCGSWASCSPCRGCARSRSPRSCGPRSAICWDRAGRRRRTGRTEDGGALSEATRRVGARCVPPDRLDDRSTGGRLGRMSRRPARDVPRWGAAPRWVETGDELDDWDTAGTVGRSTRAQATVTLLLRGVLWTGIALAVVLGLVNFAAPLTAGPPPPAGPASEPPPVPPPGGCAELVVAAWLNGDVNLLSGVPGMPRGEIEPGRREAVRTYTASVTPGDVGWGYVIGAEVRVRDDEDGWRDAGVQFFSVTMVPGAGGCQGWVPAALPAQVAAPVLTG